MVQLIHKGTNKVRVRLDPPDLGAVDIGIEVADGEVFVAMTAESASAVDEIKNQIEGLRALLEEQGLNLKKFDLGGKEPDAERSTGDGPKDEGNSTDGRINNQNELEGMRGGLRYSGVSEDGRVDILV